MSRIAQITDKVMDDEISSVGTLGSRSESAQLPLPGCTTGRGIVVWVCSDNIPFMERLPDAMFKLIVTSPPYNLGKPY